MEKLEVIVSGSGIFASGRRIDKILNYLGFLTPIRKELYDIEVEKWKQKCAELSEGQKKPPKPKMLEIPIKFGDENVKRIASKYEAHCYLLDIKLIEGYPNGLVIDENGQLLFIPMRAIRFIGEYRPKIYKRTDIIEVTVENKPKKTEKPKNVTQTSGQQKKQNSKKRKT